MNAFFVRSACLLSVVGVLTACRTEVQEDQPKIRSSASAMVSETGMMPSSPSLGEPRTEAETAESCPSPEVLIEIYERCTQEEWTDAYNCTDFAHQFHCLCQQFGIQCRTTELYCEGSGHAVNLIFLNGRWCLVDPQDGIAQYCWQGAPDPLPREAKDALCALANEPAGCDCQVTIHESPAQRGTDPSLCTRLTRDEGGDTAQCNQCCDEVQRLRRTVCSANPDADGCQQCDELDRMCRLNCRSIDESRPFDVPWWTDLPYSWLWPWQ
jgi:hypothetical protein